MIPFIGVRISWLSVARKALLACDASLAASEAVLSSRSRRPLKETSTGALARARKTAANAGPAVRISFAVGLFRFQAN